MSQNTELHCMEMLLISQSILENIIKRQMFRLKCEQAV